MASPRPVTVITGASAGIGAALARVFAGDGHELALVARRAAQLGALADEIAAGGAPRPTALVVDLERSNAAAAIGEALGRQELEPDHIVNNAGFGLLGPAAELDRDAQLAMIDLNARALTELSLAFLPSLTRRRGGVLNVASVAGFLPGPGMAVYYATKAYAISFGEALHAELKPAGVRVTTLCPGPVPTEFQSRAGIAARPANLFTLSAEAVARAGYRGLMRGKRVVVPGWGNKGLVGLLRIAPNALVARMTKRIQKARRLR
jgi:short-subunit dehydrogenase